MFLTGQKWDDLAKISLAPVIVSGPATPPLSQFLTIFTSHLGQNVGLGEG